MMERYDSIVVGGGPGGYAAAARLAQRGMRSLVVGLSEAEANREGISSEVGRFPFSVLGRARSLGETDGFVKVLSGGDWVLGVGNVVPEASERIAEAAFAIEMMAAPEDVGLTTRVHPALSEGLHKAMLHSVGEALHVLNRRPNRAGARAAVAPR